MALPLGTLLRGRFRIDAPLGHGGMGAVYLAHDLVLNSPCALKEMAPPPGLGAAEVDRLRKQFRQEASVLANLSHPGLPRVTDCFPWGEGEVLVMDYVPGESLETLIAAGGGLAEGQVLTWAGQLLDALAYCHRRGVIHRDVKPANIIITPESRAVLVDFGLVKVWDPEETQLATLLSGSGTPSYAPPEQLGTGAGHTEARSDLYSLGATLYHALTGRRPPPAHLRSADPACLARPRALKPGLTAGTEAALLRAMELGKAQRFASAEEMRAALAGPATGSRAPRRAWGLLAAAALAVILAAVALGTLVSRCGGGTPTPWATATVPLVVGQPSATEMPLPPTVTLAAPTNMPLPATDTPPPANTPLPPTDTPPPTNTALVFTATPEAIVTRMRSKDGMVMV